MLVAVMAPGLTSGFISAPLYCSTATIELNAWPVASTPMLFAIASGPCSSMTSAIVKTLEIDWIETSDVDVARRVDAAVDRDERNAEDVRIDLGERRNVVGVLAFLEVLELGVGRVEGRLDALLGECVSVLGKSRADAAIEIAALSAGDSRTNSCWLLILILPV